jgi:hypothetical protein
LTRDYLRKVVACGIVLTLLFGGSAVMKANAAASGDGVHTQLKGRLLARTNDMLRRPKNPRPFPIFEEAAGIIGIKPEELKQQVRQNKSIVEVARSKGVSEAKLTEQLLAIRSAKLDEAVKSGKLSADKAAQIKQNMAEHLKFMLNKKGLPDKPGGWHKLHGLMSAEKMAALIGITREELDKELQSGKSLAEIAQSKGISREQLVAKIKDALTPAIERRIDMKFVGNNNSAHPKRGHHDHRE